MLFSQVRQDGSAEFHYPYGEHRSVRAVGSFCGWVTPGLELSRVEYGWLGNTESLPEGDIDYKLVVDGTWVVDPQNLVRVPDGHGGHNSRLYRGSRHGAVVHLSFHAPALRAARGYVIYLPPSYADQNRRFPTLYLLHGALDWERTWVEKGDFVAAMDKLAADGGAGEMIVVMPRDNGELFRGDDRMVDYLARDLVGHIDYEFRTLPSARHRAIDGLSTGGFSSIVVGATRPDVFHSVGSMSGCHDGRTFDTIRARAEAIHGAGQRYRVFCGIHEPHVETSRAVARELERAGLEVERAEAPGIHDWPTWREALPRHLRFHAANLV